MSAAERLRHQRRLRRLEVAILIFGVLLGTFDALAGSLLAGIIAAAIVALMIWSLRLNVLTVRNLEHANRPRPDYTLIAAMERDIYGETFEHEGAPEIAALAPSRPTRPTRPCRLCEKQRRGHAGKPPGLPAGVEAAEHRAFYRQERAL